MHNFIVVVSVLYGILKANYWILYLYDTEEPHNLKPKSQNLLSLDNVAYSHADIVTTQIISSEVIATFYEAPAAYFEGPFFKADVDPPRSLKHTLDRV